MFLVRSILPMAARGALTQPHDLTPAELFRASIMEDEAADQ